MKSIDSLVSDIEALFEGHGFSSALGKFSDDLGKQFLERFKDYAEDREPTLRLSNYGRPLRQLWYELKGFPREALSPSTKFKFLFGDILERLVLLLAAESGHTVTGLQQEVCVDDVLGHVDAIIDGVLVDVKSASTYSFHKFRDGSIRDNDPFGYIPQLAAYSLGLGGIDAAFLVVDKTLGHLHLERFSAHELGSYDVRSRIKADRTAISRDSEPVRCYDDQPVSKSDKTGNRILGIPCSYCGWKSYCWRDANNGSGLQARTYSTGVKFFTRLVKEPNLKYDNTHESFPIKETA